MRWVAVLAVVGVLASGSATSAVITDGTTISEYRAMLDSAGAVEASSALSATVSMFAGMKSVVREMRSSNQYMPVCLIPPGRFMLEGELSRILQDEVKKPAIDPTARVTALAWTILLREHPCR